MEIHLNHCHEIVKGKCKYCQKIIHSNYALAGSYCSNPRPNGSITFKWEEINQLLPGFLELAEEYYKTYKFGTADLSKRGKIIWPRCLKKHEREARERAILLGAYNE